MRAIVFLAVLFAISPALASPSTCWIGDPPTCKRYVGKRLWVYIPAGNPNVVEVTFTRGDWTTARTAKLKSGASFLVTGVVEAGIGSSDYAVRLDDGRSGWAGTSSPFLIDFDPAARAKAASAECERRGQPKIGMTSVELVETCWRKPSRIVKKTTAAGTQELYLYGIGHRVTLVDGKVSEILRPDNAAEK